MPIRFTFYDPRADKNGNRRNPRGLDQDYVNARNLGYTRAQESADSLYDPRSRNTHLNRIKNALRPIFASNPEPVSNTPTSTTVTPISNSAPLNPVNTPTPLAPNNTGATTRRRTNRNRPNNTTTPNQTVPPSLTVPPNPNNAGLTNANQANTTLLNSQSSPTGQTVTPPNPTVLAPNVNPTPNTVYGNPTTGRSRNRNQLPQNVNVTSPTVIGTPNTAYTNNSTTANPNRSQNATQAGFGGRNQPPTTYSNASATATYDEIDAQNTTPVNEAGKFSWRNLGRAIRNKPLEGERGVAWDNRFKNNPQAIRQRLEINNEATIAEQKKKTLVAQETARKEYEERIEEINDQKQTNKDELVDRIRNINESGPTDKEIRKQALQHRREVKKLQPTVYNSLTKQEQEELATSYEQNVKNQEKKEL